MRTLMLAGATALAIAAIPAAVTAQDQSAETAPAASEAPPPAPVPPASAEPAPRTAAEANARATPLPTTTEVLPAEEPGAPETVVITHHGNLAPPPATALNKTYPLCTRSLQDSCRNPGEGEGEETALGG